MTYFPFDPLLTRAVMSVGGANWAVLFDARPTGRCTASRSRAPTAASCRR
ncbi:MAG: hypothetical protein R2939_10800 [Kofleriaceae bacterium]